MKRNWDLIRELLHSIEIMDQEKNEFGRDPKDKFVDDWGYFDKNLYQSARKLTRSIYRRS